MNQLNLPNYKIVNIVSSWNIGPIEINVDNSQRKKKFNAQVIRKPKGVLLVFASGRITATGFTKLSDVEPTLIEVFPSRKIVFIRVVNIVASSTFSKKFNTEKLKRCKGASYEPELFPPIYNKFGNVTIMYFHTGSIVIVGAKQINEIDSAIAQFMSRVSLL